MAVDEVDTVDRLSGPDDHVADDHDDRVADWLSTFADAGEAADEGRDQASEKDEQPAHRQRLARHRVGFAELGVGGRLVEAAGNPADREQAKAVLAGPDLALRPGRDPDDVVGVEREALALDLDLAGPRRARKTSSWPSPEWSCSG